MTKENNQIIFILVIFTIFLGAILFTIFIYSNNDKNNNKKSDIKDIKDVKSTQEKVEKKFKCFNNSCQETNEQNAPFSTLEDCEQYCKENPANVYNIQYEKPYYPTSLYPSFVPFYGIRHYRRHRHPFRRDLTRRERRRIRRSIRP